MSTKWKDAADYEQLQKTPVYKCLTEKAKNEAGHTKKSIMRFLEDKVYPLQCATIEEFITTQLHHDTRIRSQFNYFYKENEKLTVLKSNQCLLTGVPIELQFASWIVMWKNTKEFKIADFIPIHCDTSIKDWKTEVAWRFGEALLFSRLHYVYHGVYLPIAINVSLYCQPPDDPTCAGKIGHNVSFLFLPNSGKFYWNRIFIDSSGASRRKDYFMVVYTTLSKILDTKWNEFVVNKERYQSDTLSDLNFSKVYQNDADLTDCARRFQGKRPTCTFWTFGLIFCFLRNYELQPQLMSDKQSIEMWCDKFQDTVRGAGMRKIYFKKVNRVFVDLQRWLHAFVFSPLQNVYGVQKPNVFRKTYINQVLHHKTLLHAENIAQLRSEMVPKLLQDLHDGNLFENAVSEPSPGSHVSSSKSHRTSSDTIATSVKSSSKSPQSRKLVENMRNDDIEKKTTNINSATKALNQVRLGLKVRPRMLIDDFIRQRVASEMKRQYPQFSQSDIDTALHPFTLLPRKKNQRNPVSEKALKDVLKQLLSDDTVRKKVIKEMKNRYPNLSMLEIERVVHNSSLLTHRSRKSS